MRTQGQPRLGGGNITPPPTTPAPTTPAPTTPAPTTPAPFAPPQTWIEMETHLIKTGRKSKIVCGIFVENLATSVTEEDLETFFSFFGQVKKVKLDKEQKGRIYMDDQASAIKAVKALDKQILDDQRITCRLMKPDDGATGSSVPSPMNNQQQQPHITKTDGQSNRVMISNLPHNMSFERISAMTTTCGNVRNINVNENGTAIVAFAKKKGAEKFIRSNNKKVIDGFLITVKSHID